MQCSYLEGDLRKQQRVWTERKSIKATLPLGEARVKRWRRTLVRAVPAKKSGLLFTSPCQCLLKAGSRPMNTPELWPVMPLLCDSLQHAGGRTGAALSRAQSAYYEFMCTYVQIRMCVHMCRLGYVYIVQNGMCVHTCRLGCAYIRVDWDMRAYVQTRMCVYTCRQGCVYIHVD